MIIRVKQLDNGLAIPIPSAIAKKAGLKPDEPVEVSLVDGKLLVVPVAEAAPTLDQLLADITEENLHHEVGTGRAIGNEAW